MKNWEDELQTLSKLYFLHKAFWKYVGWRSLIGNKIFKILSQREFTVK